MPSAVSRLLLRSVFVVLSITGLVSCNDETLVGPRLSPNVDPTFSTTSGDGLSVIQVAAGVSFTCGLRIDRTVACWGQDLYNETRPRPGLYLSISAGEDSHVCGLRLDQTIACWGNNDVGQASPPSGNGWLQVISGYGYSCALGAGGGIVCWGSGSVTTTIPAGSFTRIFGGTTHACALRQDGTAACWGANGSGQATAPSGTFRWLAPGNFHTCGLRQDSKLACWGGNPVGQASPPDGEFDEITAGYEHSCARRRNLHGFFSEVVCWGGNDPFGQTTSPAVALGGIDAGAQHTCGLTAGGAVVCWGRNFEGQSDGSAATAQQVYAAADEMLFVTNRSGASVVAVPTNAAAVKHIEVGPSPWGIAVSPDHRHLVVAINGSRSLGIIDAVARTHVTFPNAIDPAPAEAAWGSGGGRAWVSHSNSTQASVVEQTFGVTNAPLRLVPQAWALTPDGGFLHYAEKDGCWIEILNTQTRGSVGRYNPGCGINDIAFSPDGRFVYASTSFGQVAVYDQVAQSFRGVNLGAAGDGLAVTPDGRTVYVATSAGVKAVTTQIPATVKTIPIPNARDVAVSPDGRKAYVIGPNKNGVSVIDVRRNEWTTDLPLNVQDPARIVVVRPPGADALQAAFTGPSSTVEGTPVMFDATTSVAASGAPIVKYDWSFGDGTTATTSSAAAMHTFADNPPPASGTSYTVAVVVTDAQGRTSRAERQIEVHDQPPHIDVPPNMAVAVGEPFRFGASFFDHGVNDEPWQYVIEWGDGTPPTGPAPTANGSFIEAEHTYQSAGSFFGTVTITDKDGFSTTAQFQVEAISANRTPVADVGGPYSGAEGGVVQFNASASDEDGDVLTFVWDFGDGTDPVVITGPAGQTPAHVYKDNGQGGAPYTVRLTVSDAQGASVISQTLANIANVDPQVAVVAPTTTLLAGETFTASASFTDSGADTWTGTVSYGVGAPPPLAAGLTPGATIPLGVTYAAAGTYTVAVTISDDDGGSHTATVQVIVQSPAQAAEEVSSTVENLVQSGTLSEAEASSVTASLDAAASQLATGNATAGVNQLQAAQHKIDAMVASGRLSAATAQQLREAIDRIIRQA